MHGPFARDMSRCCGLTSVPMRLRRYVKNAEVEGKYYEQKERELEAKKAKLVSLREPVPALMQA